MNQLLTIIILIVTVLAGGGTVLLLKKKDKQQVIKILLAFSGGFLLSIAFIHFIPELYAHSEHPIGIYILLGFLIQLLLEFFSGGIEHGHVHHHHFGKIPWGVVLALAFHSILEGIPLAGQLSSDSHLATVHHHHTGDFSLLLGIVLHRIPVAIALMTLLLASNVKQSVTWLVLFFFAITTPIGMGIGEMGTSFFDEFDFNLILAVVVGMFLHISTTIIFETGENHKFNLFKLVSIIGGFGVAILLH